MGFIYGIKYIIFQGNLPKTYSLTSWLRQRSVHWVQILANGNLRPPINDGYLKKMKSVN